MKKGILMSLLVSAMMLLPWNLYGAKTMLTVSGYAVQTTKVYDQTTDCQITNYGTLSGVKPGDDVYINTLATTASYDDANVGTEKEVTITYVLGGTDAGNYRLQPVYLDADITPAQLNVVNMAAQPSKVYDGSTSATVTQQGTLKGLLEGDVVNLSTVAAYTDADAGTNKTVTFTFTVSGNDVGNYTTPSSKSSSGYTITQKQLTATNTIIEQTKVYDGTTNCNVMIAGTLGGVVSGDESDVELSATAVYNNKNVGANKDVTVTYTIDGDKASNYVTPVSSTVKASITERPLYAKPYYHKVKQYDGGAVAKVDSVRLSNTIPGDDIVGSATASYNDKTVNSGKTITIKYSTSGADAGNYSSITDSVCNDGEITKRQTTISTFSLFDKSKSYDGTDTAHVRSAGTLDNVVAGDNVTLNAKANYAGRADNTIVGNALDIKLTYTLSGSDAANYLAPSDSTVGGVGSITQKQLSVSGTALNSKVYDGNLTGSVQTEGTLSGVVSGDDVTLSATATYRTADVAAEKAVDVDFSISGNDAFNYIAPDDEVLTSAITKRQLTLASDSVSSVEKVYDGNTIATVNVTAGAFTNLISSDAGYVFVSALGTYDNKNVDVNKDVTATFTISGTRSPNYSAPATMTIHDGKITPKHVSVLQTAVATPKEYDGNTDATVTNDGFISVIGSDVVNVSATATFADKNVGYHAITVAYTLDGADKANYIADNSTISNGEITQRYVDVVTDATVQPTKVYDGNDSCKVLTNGVLDNVVSGDVLSAVATAHYQDALVGTHKVVNLSYHLEGASMANYQLNSSTSTTFADITQRPTTASGTMVQDRRAYNGGTEAAVTDTGHIYNIIAGDDVRLYPVANYDNAQAGKNKTITVHYTLLGSAANNYTAPADSVVTNNGEIYDVKPTVSGTKIRAKVYDGNTTAYIDSVGTLSGVRPEDDVQLSATATYDNASVGKGKRVVVRYSLSGTQASNYQTPDSVILSADITRRQLTVSGTTVAATRLYNRAVNAEVTNVGTLYGNVGSDDVTLDAVATYADATVGQNKSVTVVYSLTGNDTANYIAPVSATLTASIDPIQLYAANTDVTKVKEYDNGVAAAVTAGSLSGVLSGDVVTLSATAEYESADIDTGKQIIVRFTIDGEDAANYIEPADSVIYDGEITTRQLTVSGTQVNGTKDYDGTTNATVTNNGTLDNTLYGHNIVVYAHAYYEDKNAGSDKVIYIIYTIGGADSAYYSAPKPDTLYHKSISSTVVSVSGATVADKEYDGTHDATVTNHGTIDGKFAGDSVYVRTDARFVLVSEGNRLVALRYSLYGPDSANYIVLPALDTTYANITRKQLEIEFHAQVTVSKVYDGTDTCHVTSDGTLKNVCPGDIVSLKATARYDTKNVGTNKDIIVSYSILGADTVYIVPVNDTIKVGEITQAEVQVLGTQVADKMYDGTINANVISNGTLSGLMSCDSAQVTLSASAQFADKNVGQDKPVTLTYTISDNNYKVSPAANVTADITPRTVHASGAVIAPKSYDGTTSATVSSFGTVATILSGDDVQVIATGQFDDPHPGSNKSVTVTYSLTGAQAGNYVLDTDQGSAVSSINKRQLTTDGNPGFTVQKTYDGTDTCHIESLPSLTGVVSGESVTLTASAAYDSKDVATGKSVTVSYSISGPDASNYEAPQPYTSTGTGEITCAPLTIVDAAVQPSKIYDADTTANVTSFGTLQGVMPCDSGLVSISSLIASYPSKNVGNYNMQLYCKLAGSMKDNYYLADTPTVNAIILPDTLTVYGASVKPKTYDGSTSATVNSVGTLSGVYSGDDVTLNTVAEFLYSNVDNCQSAQLAYNLYGNDKDNYVVSPATTLTCAAISKASLSSETPAITLTKEYDGAADAQVSNYPDTVITANNDTIIIFATALYDSKTAGTGKSVTITYTLSGTNASNYETPAPHTYNTGVINQRQLTLGSSAIDGSKVYDGTTTANVNSAGSLSGVIVGDSVSVNITANYLDKNVSPNRKPVSVNAELVGNDALNYYIVSSYTDSAYITCKTLAVSGTTISADKVYDGTRNATIDNLGTLVGVVSSDDVTLSATAEYDTEQPTANANVTVYYSIAGTDSSNYCISDVVMPQSYTISRATLRATNVFMDTAKIYDASVATRVTCDSIPVGIVPGSGDDVYIRATAQFDNKNVGKNKSIVIRFALTGQAASKYDTPNDSIVTNGVISPDSLIISGIQIDTFKMYDGTDVAEIIQDPVMQNLWLGDTVSLAASAYFDNANAGSGKYIYAKYVISGADAHNYCFIDSVGWSDQGHIFQNVTPKTSGADSTRCITTGNSSYCVDDEIITLSYDSLNGEPYEYRIEFSNDAKTQGFEDVAWRPFDYNDSIAPILIPENCTDGHYIAVVQFRNEVQARDESSVARRDTVDIYINLSKNYITDIFFDVVSIDNREERFHSFQWYKNDKVIPGATLPYYQDQGGLDGKYSVLVNIGEPTEAIICPNTFKHTADNAPAYITAYPNPVVNQVSIKLVNFAEGEHTLRMVNQMGVTVVYDSFEGETHDLDLSSLPVGTYTIIVDDKNVKIIKK